MPKQHLDGRRAFTLTELLVVIGIVVVIAAIALPAINSVREAGRRTGCMAHQVRLASAISVHDERCNHLPGWRNPLRRTDCPACDEGAVDEVVWAVMILPFLERQDLFTALAAGQHRSSRSGGVVNVSQFICPSIGAQATAWNLLHYAANSGTGSGHNSLKGEQPNRNDGVLVDNLHPPKGGVASLEDIREGDGISVTLLLADSGKGGKSNWYAGFETRGYFKWNAAFGIAWNPPSNSKVVNAGLEGIPASKHPGGVNVVFADTSNRFLTDGIAPHVYSHLVTSNSCWSPFERKYFTNTNRANGWLMHKAPLPYELDPKDY